MGDGRRAASREDGPRPDDIGLLRLAASRLTTEQFLRLVGQDEESARHIKGVLRVPIEPRRNPRAFADLARRRILGAPADVLLHVCALMSDAVRRSAVELLGDNADHPNQSHIEAVIDPLVELHGLEMVRLCFAAVACADLPAAPVLRALLRSDERLRVPDDREDGPAGPASEREARSSEDGVPAYEVIDSTKTFRPLDRLLITSAVATLLGEEGALGPEELVELVQEVVSLNSQRKNSYFHVGFVESLGLEIPPPRSEGMNEERWLWYWAGRLYGIARRRDRESLLQLCDGPELQWLFEVCGTRQFGPGIAEFVVNSLLGGERFSLVEQFLNVLPLTAVERRLTEPVVKCARSVLSAEPSAAAKLFAAVHERLTVLLEVLESASSREGDDLDEELSRIRELAFQVRRYLAASRRALDDFPAAEQIVDELLAAAHEVGSRSRALAWVEKALVDARIRHLTDVKVPPPHHEHVLTGRLDPVLEHLRSALGSDPRSPQASYLLGIHAFCGKDYESAVRYLEMAESAMSGEAVYEESGLVAETSFYEGLALLSQLDAARMEQAWASLVRSLDRGMRPHRDRILEAARALVVMDRHDRAVELVLRCAKGKRLRPFFEVISDAVAAGDLLATEALLRLRTKPPDIDEGTWLSALVRGIQAAATADRSDITERLLDLVDDLVHVGSRESLEMWLTCVDGSSDVREMLGFEDAELRCVELLYRLGRPEEARDRLEKLIWRIHDRPNYALEDLLGLLAQYGASPDAVDSLRSRLRGMVDETEQRPVPLVDSPMTVVFVGGNETQKQYRESIEEELGRRYGSMVRVEWFFTGWSPNWGEHAERVERRFPDAEAMVIMQFVRTNLGRRLRRRAGEAGLPWIACTGHGREAILRSLEQAVEVAAERR